MGMIHISIFTMLSFLALISHGKAMLTDPGMDSQSALHALSILITTGAVPSVAVPIVLANVPKAERDKYEDHKFRTCRRCRTFKPARAHHCSTCQRCVIKMDHQ